MLLDGGDRQNGDGARKIQRAKIGSGEIGPAAGWKHVDSLRGLERTAKVCAEPDPVSGPTAFERCCF